MNYYFLGRNIFAKGYAYSQYERDIKRDYDLAEKCPLCGRRISGAKILPPYQVVLSTKKLGDFIFGSFHHCIVSANFKERYEKSDMSGIKEFKKIHRLRFRKEILEAEYYWVFPERVNVRLEPIEVVEADNGRPICQLCNPTGKIDYGVKGLKMNLNGQEKTPDIFLTYINGGSTYCNQRFVDFCQENKFTNFESQTEPFEDYVSGCLSASQVAASWKD